MSCSNATPQSTWPTYPDKFFWVTTPLADDGGGRDVEKGGVALRGHGLGQKGLPRARWTIQQDSFPWRQDALEQLRVLDRHAHFESQGLRTADCTGQKCALRDKALEQLRVQDKHTLWETRPWNSWGYRTNMHTMRDKALEQLRVQDKHTLWETRPWNSWGYRTNMHTMRDKALEQLTVLDKHAHYERQGFGTAEGTGQTCTLWEIRFWNSWGYWTNMLTVRDKVLEQLRVLDKHAHTIRDKALEQLRVLDRHAHSMRQGLGTAVGTGQTHMHFERQGLRTAEGTEALEQLWVLDRHVHTLRDKAWNSWEYWGLGTDVGTGQIHFEWQGLGTAEGTGQTHTLINKAI